MPYKKEGATRESDDMLMVDMCHKHLIVPTPRRSSLSLKYSVEGEMKMEMMVANQGLN